MPPPRPNPRHSRRHVQRFYPRILLTSRCILPASMKVSRRKTRSRIFGLARGPGRWSRPATRRSASSTPAKVGKTPQSPPSWLARALSRLDRARALLIVALVACATLPYLNILFNGFVYDDDTQLVENPYVRSFHYLKEIFTTNVWSFSGAAVSNYYRPMMTLGYLVCYKLFGMRAYGFHLVSLLLHVLVVCLVFALTERLTGDRVWALVARRSVRSAPGSHRVGGLDCRGYGPRGHVFLSPHLWAFSRGGKARGWAFGAHTGGHGRHVSPCPAFQGAGDDSAGARHGL